MARVKKKTEKDFFVIIGNPPYNTKQANENDNNKNRKYPVIDERVKETYSQDSKATNSSALFDPYVKAIRWASDRIGDEGIVAFVTNSSFLDGISFDGMRKYLAQDFSKIYVLDLGGNARKNPGKTSNVFDIMVGVSINFFVKSSSTDKGIYYAHVGDDLKKEEKLNYLLKNSINSIEWQLIQPNDNNVWLTDGLHSEFEDFIPLGTKAKKAAKREVEGVLFKTYSSGVITSRDAWVYNFNLQALTENMQHTIEVYNDQVEKWIKRDDRDAEVDDFVLYDDSQISWSRDLKLKLKRKKLVKFDNEKIRTSLYRPFTKSNLFFDFVLVDEPGQFPKIVPTPSTENENRVISCTNHSQIPFVVQITNCIPDVAFGGRNGQCFPFYTYNKDGSNRQENLTNWALNHYRHHYKDKTITKWDIFHYVYGLLHHPGYRKKYAANLKRELPRLPMTPDFWAFADAGKKLADLHLNYELQKPYPLKMLGNKKVLLTGIKNNTLSMMRVEKMRLSKDKTKLTYNALLTLGGIPKEVFEYKLGNRSALEWVIDQYRVKVDKRSGIINDPNREDDHMYIVELVKKVVAVSLETVGVIEGLPDYI